MADLARYRPPATAGQRAASAGISLAPTTGADAAGVLAFEAATFPSWVRWFGAGDRDVLIARDGSGSIAGTLLFEGPSADTVLAPMLGPRPGLGCVGVAPDWWGWDGTALGPRARNLASPASHLPHQLDHPRVLLPLGDYRRAAVPFSLPARRRVVRLMWPTRTLAQNLSIPIPHAPRNARHSSGVNRRTALGSQLWRGRPGKAARHLDSAVEKLSELLIRMILDQASRAARCVSLPRVTR